MKKNTHNCKNCYKIVDSYKGKNGQDTYQYPKLCLFCSKNKVKKIPKKRIRIKKYVSKVIVVENNPKYDFRIDKVITVEPLPIPQYCAYEGCRCLLHLDDTRLFCDDWCREMSILSKISNPLCNKCGEITGFIEKKNGHSSSVPRLLCDKCYKDKFGREYK